MNKLLPLLLLASAPVYADMNHSISSSVKFESLSAASTADKIGLRILYIQKLCVTSQT